MPGGDRTGPMGVGPMTGRGAGYCAGYSVPGYVNPAGRQEFGYGRRFGRGYRRGRGFGRGFGWRWAAAPYAGSYYGAPAVSAKDEARALKEQAQAMQDEIIAINQRIKELESASGTEGNG